MWVFSVTPPFPQSLAAQRVEACRPTESTSFSKEPRNPPLRGEFLGSRGRAGSAYAYAALPPSHRGGGRGESPGKTGDSPPYGRRESEDRPPPAGPARQPMRPSPPQMALRAPQTVDLWLCALPLHSSTILAAGGFSAAFEDKASSAAGHDAPTARIRRPRASAARIVVIGCE